MTTQPWEKKFDEMTPQEIPSENNRNLYGPGSVDEWLKHNSDKHLYVNEVYGEPMLDLDEGKIKKFISSTLQQERERIVREILSIKHHTCVSQFGLEKTINGDIIPSPRSEADFIPVHDIEEYAKEQGVIKNDKGEHCDNPECTICR